jgi:Fe-S cluster assembly protein SufD
MKSVTVSSSRHIIKFQSLDTLPVCEYKVQESSHLTVIVYTESSDSLEGSVHVRLVGDHASAHIIGVFLCSNQQHISLHTLQQHEARDTESNLLVKAVLQDNARFYYDGAIRVEPEGQKTDAYQRNENLLLSDTAHAESKPSLEILADDVRCTHGATIGDIDNEQLFYLASRGIHEAVGKQLITQGFLNAALEKVGQTKEVDKVRQHLWNNL